MIFFARRRREAARRMALQARLREMDAFFAERPWGVFTADASHEMSMGAFREDAVSPEDFYEEREGGPAAASPGRRP
ncbi:MAG: hypothetical protein LBG06_07570 [Deltaproteobacteria bacterium]|jgi:hypothetical protein|nr:hypothetical protein [Deltaproteobacteria bacterium]